MGLSHEMYENSITKVTLFCHIGKQGQAPRREGQSGPRRQLSTRPSNKRRKGPLLPHLLSNIHTLTHARTVGAHEHKYTHAYTFAHITYTRGADTVFHPERGSADFIGFRILEF